MEENKSLQEQVDRLLSIGIDVVNVRKAMMEKGFSIIEIESAIQSSKTPQPEIVKAPEPELPLEEQVQRLINIGINPKDVRAALQLKGYSPEEIDPLIQKTPLPPIEKAPVTRKVFTAISALIPLLLAFYLLPLSVLHDYTTFIAIVFSAWFAVSLGMFLNSFKSRSNYFWVKGGMAFASFWIFAIGFIFHETELEDKEFDNYGKIAIGRVIDGSSLSTRRNKTAKLVVTFKTDNDKEIRARINVGEREFESAYMNQQIFVLYSSRYPFMARIVRDREDILKYLKENNIQ